MYSHSTSTHPFIMALDIDKNVLWLGCYDDNLRYP